MWHVDVACCGHSPKCTWFERAAQRQLKHSSGGPFLTISSASMDGVGWAVGWPFPQTPATPPDGHMREANAYPAAWVHASLV
eukprot:1151171-Pelagomonas_calceolata.AAC.2